MATVVYSINADFTNHKVATSLLQDEINANSGLAAKYQHISTEDDVCTVYFSSELNDGEENDLHSIVLAHSGMNIVAQILTTATLRNGEKAITLPGDWDEVGGVVTDPSFFDPNVNELLGRITCMIKTDGAGASLRIVEYQASPKLLTDPVVALPDTGNNWTPFQFDSNIPPNFGPAFFRLEGTLGTATSASIKCAVIALVQVKIS